jgi:hypothetical protein
VILSDAHRARATLREPHPKKPAHTLMLSARMMLRCQLMWRMNCEPLARWKMGIKPLGQNCCQVLRPRDVKTVLSTSSSDSVHKKAPLKLNVLQQSSQDILYKIQLPRLIAIMPAERGPYIVTPCPAHSIFAPLLQLYSDLFNRICLSTVDYH